MAQLIEICNPNRKLLHDDLPDEFKDKILPVEHPEIKPGNPIYEEIGSENAKKKKDKKISDIDDEKKKGMLLCE